MNPFPLILVLMNPDMPCLCKQLDLDQLASALFVIKCLDLYQQFVSSNMTGWKLEVDVAS